VVWEVVRTGLGAFAKRISEKDASKRKAVGEQCGAARTRVSECLNRAVEFLTAPCTTERREELQRLILHDLRTLAQAIQDVNAFAGALKTQPLSQSYLITFRQAITWHFGSKSYKPQGHDSEDVRRAYSAGQAFQTELTRLQLAST